jgi:hypothetical protein
VLANGDAGKDRRGATEPDMGAETNWGDPDWTRRLQGMVFRVKKWPRGRRSWHRYRVDAVIGTTVVPVLMKTRLPSTRVPFWPAPKWIGITALQCSAGAVPRREYQFGRVSLPVRMLLLAQCTVQLLATLLVGAVLRPFGRHRAVA